MIELGGRSYFYQNKRYGPLETERKFFIFFISEISHFSYMRFFKKMFNVSSEHSFTVACRIHIWKKKHLVKIVTSLVTVLLKMACLCICFVKVKLWG